MGAKKLTNNLKENLTECRIDDERELKASFMYVITAKMSKRDVKIMTAYFFDKKNTLEISEEVGITRQRVTDILHKGLRCLNATAIMRVGVREWGASLRKDGYESAISSRVAQEDGLNLPVDALPLSIRSHSCLVNYGDYSTVRDILDGGLEKLKKIRGIGKASLYEIVGVLSDYGFRFDQKEAEQP